MIVFCANCNNELNRRPCRARGRNYCDGKCQMNYEYLNGIRDPKTIANRAHQTIRNNGQPKLIGKLPGWILDGRILEIGKKISLKKNGIRIPKLQGKNHWNWQGGIDKGVWFTWPYKQWRIKVFERDNFMCQNCGDDIGGNLHAHHVKPKFLFPELIFDIKNGLTLCEKCHKQTDSYGLKVKTLNC